MRLLLLFPLIVSIAAFAQLNNGGSGAGGAATQVLMPTAVQPAPSGALTSECPGVNGNNPAWWMKDENGSYRSLSAIDTFTDPVNGPATAAFVFCHHIAFNDTGTTPISGKNAAFALFHQNGVGAVLTNQDRGISIVTQNGNSDIQTHYGIEGIQVETRLQGNPAAVNGSPDGEVSAGSFQLADTHVNSIAYPNQYGVNGIRITSSRSGAGVYSSCNVCFTGIRVNTINNTNATFNAGFMVGGYFTVGDGAAGTANVSGAALWVVAGATAGHMAGSNWGIHIVDVGTGALDRNIHSAGSMPSSGRNEFQGPVTLATWTPVSSSDTCITGTVTWDAGFVYVCTATNTWKRAALVAF